MNLFAKIRELNLAQTEFVVVGGGVLVAHGLLEWDEDVDMCVAPEVFDAFKRQGWRQESWKGKPVLKHGVYDIGVGFGEWSLTDLQDDAMWIEEIPFMSLDKLLAWKRQTGREKDLRHIKIIENYLAKG
jgi:hypothetical protein